MGGEVVNKSRWPCFMSKFGGLIARTSSAWLEKTSFSRISCHSTTHVTVGFMQFYHGFTTIYLVGGLEHFSFVYNMWYIPSHWLIFFKMVIAPPTSYVVDWNLYFCSFWKFDSPTNKQDHSRFYQLQFEVCRNCGWFVGSVVCISSHRWDRVAAWTHCGLDSLVRHH